MKKKKKLNIIWKKAKNSSLRMNEISNEENRDQCERNQTNHTTQSAKCLQKNSRWQSRYSPIVQSENHSKVNHSKDTAVCWSFYLKLW